MDSNKVERAVAKMSDPISTPEELIAASEKHIPAIKANTAISSEVTTAADQWNTSHLAYVASNKKVVDADVAAAKARTERATAERDLLGRARGCLLAITVDAAGSEAAIKAYGVDVAERLGSPLETTPTGLIGVKTLTTGLAGWKWKTHKRNHGFMVQWATDPTNAATHSAQIHCTKGRFSITAQTPGATLYLRVAALDSRLLGGQTAYSAWVSVPVGQ